jgi:putative DNA primase/helicase
VLQGDRWTKLPFQVSGRCAKSNDPSTWTTFERALAAYRGGGFDGLEFMLGDGWAGLDVDHCYGDLDDHQWFLDQLLGYVDRSPSSKGCKVFGRSPRIGGQIDFAVYPPARTTWSSPRPFTVTGHGHGDPTVDITAFLNDWFPAKPTAPPSTREGYALADTFNDYDLAMQMFGADNGDKALALWRGDLSAHGGDHSRADLALITILAFWTNYNLDRVDRMFQQSGLMRDKWNTGSYRTATLGKVAQ